MGLIPYVVMCNVTRLSRMSFGVPVYEPCMKCLWTLNEMFAHVPA